MKSSSIRTILLTWLAWVIIVISFQALAAARFAPQWPDRAQEWTEQFTSPTYQNDKPYLLEPFFNQQVAWDSEFYLAIAIGGYDDPNIRHIDAQGFTTTSSDYRINQYSGGGGPKLSLSYAFFPFYPLMMRLFAIPLSIFGLNPVATATLAGIFVSALGALMGMFALYDLTRDSLDEDGALRAVFYLIIFPTGFFLVQVYTEGLFVGLAFGCLAMLKRKNWLLAALLGAAATLTRAVGAALILPMLIAWFRTGEWMALDLEWRQIFYNGIPLKPLGRALLAFAPAITFLIWKFSFYGMAFDFIEANYFGRSFINLGYAFYSWSTAIRSMFGGNPQHTAYYLTELLGLGLGFLACFLSFKRDPELAWFSFMVVLISWGSGPAQGMHRYILGAPIVFTTLARWGKNPAFDRAWTILSILLMGLLATLFAFDMWVA
jgi:hypothetical protein